MSWSGGTMDVRSRRPTPRSKLPGPPSLLPVCVHLALVLMLGLWIPPCLAGWYRLAAEMIG